MIFVYVVRCRFTEPAREQAWNAWYSGPKIEQMLAQPLFRTCQRFRRAAGTGRDYLTVWTVENPQALATRQYRAQWGFAEWTPHITDWSRDLFDGGSASEAALAVPADGALAVAAFDHMSEDAAAAARDKVARAEPDMMWLPAIGLDRHTPIIGLHPLANGAAAGSVQRDGDSRVQRAMYRPITRHYSAPQVPEEAADR
jgi:hypothetical protein